MLATPASGVTAQPVHYWGYRRYGYWRGFPLWRRPHWRRYRSRRWAWRRHRGYYPYHRRHDRRCDDDRDGRYRLSRFLTVLPYLIALSQAAGSRSNALAYPWSFSYIT